jgi:hypothetical protein
MRRQEIAGLEALDEHERLAPHVVECELELGGAVGRIEVDQDESRFGARELRQGPLGAVGGPDADAIAGQRGPNPISPAASRSTRCLSSA